MNDNSEKALDKAIKEEVKAIYKPSYNEEAEPSNIKTIVTRQDTAKKVYERQKVAIAGILNTPLLYLQKRIELIDQLASHVIVNREQMSITLVVHEEDYFQHTVSGSLEYHPNFLEFKINKGVYQTPSKWGDFFRMKRAFFQNRQECTNLVTTLKNFTASVNKELNLAENKNGDRYALIDQKVKSNIPESIELVVPVFKGYPKENFSIEVHVNPEDLTATLVSPEVAERVDDIRDKFIDEVLESIKQTAPKILITEE